MSELQVRLRLAANRRHNVYQHHVDATLMEDAASVIDSQEEAIGDLVATLSEMDRYCDEHRLGCRHANCYEEWQLLRDEARRAIAEATP